MNTKLLATTAFLSAALLAESQTPTYQVIDIGALLEPRVSYALGINNNGQIVGYFNTPFGASAFLYSRGSIHQIPGSPPGSGIAYAINYSGQVVGSYTAGDGIRAYRYTSGVAQGFDVLATPVSVALGINHGGQVVGYYTANDGNEHAFLHSNGRMMDIHELGYKSRAIGINSSGHIVGVFYPTTSNPFSRRPFLYSNGKMHDLGTFGGVSAVALGINDSGQVVGERLVSNSPLHQVFLYENGSVRDIGISGSNGVLSFTMTCAINAHGDVVVGRAFSPAQSSNRYYLYSRGVVYELMDLIAHSGWRVTDVNAINDSGQIVGSGIHPSGKQHAMLLNPIPNGWQRAIDSQTIKPTYSDAPVKRPGKDSLIMVTHGWQPSWKPVDVSWVVAMTNAISKFLTGNSLSNWQINAHIWVEKANTLFPRTALDNGEQEGGVLGRSLVRDNWEHIHFIAHSAGSALIQAATEVITKGSSNTTIHETFLDAYTGLTYGGRKKYGSGAEWCDSYFTRDKETLPAFDLTEGPLDHTYNVDVTWLDPNKEERNVFVSSLLGDPQHCTRTVTSHSWPHEFYFRTTIQSWPDAEGLGFPLSKEGGNWDYATNQYPVGNQTLRELGEPDTSCFVQAETIETILSKIPDFTTEPTTESNTGTIQKWIHGLRMSPGSPVWLATFVALTNPANFVSFDTWFESANDSEGLLSVYWDTNVIGSVDERAVVAGLQHYAFTFPNTSANGTHVLGFRLDAFTNAPSSVIVTNVSLRFAGPTEPFLLTATTNTSDGLRVFQVRGQIGFNYSLESSTNLTDWGNIALLVNTNGTVPFVDPNSTNYSKRFYRVSSP